MQYILKRKKKYFLILFLNAAKTKNSIHHDLKFIENVFIILAFFRKLRNDLRLKLPSFSEK